MKTIRRVIVCGPPHSGKSVFLANLQRLLPGEHHMLIFGAPDGEWHWSHEAQAIVSVLREKKRFTKEWCDGIVAAIRSAEQRLVLVDTGGKRLPPNDEIFSSCDGFIILSSSPEEVNEWRKYGESFGCRCLAELDSVLEGTSELYENREDGIIRGRLAGLKRENPWIKSPVLDAVAKLLREVIEANAEVTEAERAADINGEGLVHRLEISDTFDPYLGVRPWHTAQALRLTAVASRLETVRIWNVRASFLTCAFAAALPGKVKLFGVSEGYVQLPDVVPSGNGGGNGVEWEVTELSEYTLVEYRKTGFFTKEMLGSVVPPTVNPRKGVVLSTDGPPIWLDATIARSYAKARAPWIALFVPVESGRAQPSLGGRKWSDVRPHDGPCVVIHGPEHRLGEIIPVPISLLKWQGGGRRWQLGSGETVADRPGKSHVATHESVLPLLHEALSRIQADGREFIAEEVNFGKVIGQNVRVETREGDDIVFARRPNRRGLTRFVKNREPEPCSTVVVCLKRVREGGYILLTAYIGTRAPAEPWDTEWATEQSVPFWNAHALIWGHEETVSGTETKDCPW